MKKIIDIIIPVIIAIVGGTLGYANKGYLGAIAGFFRFGFYYYVALFIMCFLFFTIYEYWTFLLGLLLLIAFGSFIFFVIWIGNKLSWFFNNY